MSRFALICVVASGCFYTDPINQRPSLDIKQLSSGTIYRSALVSLQAIANDPDGDFVTFSWRAYSCTDQTDCDQAPFFEKSDEVARFMVQDVRVDKPTPVTAVLVLLEGKDEYGATSRPIQQLLLAIADHPPVLALAKTSRYDYVVNTPIRISASVTDPDDSAQEATVAWQVYTPTSNPAYDFTDFTITSTDPEAASYGKVFTPHGTGEWIIEVTATDHLGASTKESVMVNVGADAPPWLSQIAPIVAPNGAALPLTEPTLFQVTIVRDDLDPYPTVPDDPVQGTTTFAWSLLPPGASVRQVLTGITTNHVALDPASYAPGDIVELRVEIQDRNATPITCADSMPTCSVISDPQRLQRQTWRVEVR